MQSTGTEPTDSRVNDQKTQILKAQITQTTVLFNIILKIIFKSEIRSNKVHKLTAVYSSQPIITCAGPQLL